MNEPSTTPAAAVEDLLVEVSQALTTVRHNLDLIETLTNTRKPPILGFATVDGKIAAGRLVTVEREARRENEQKGRPTGSGDVPAAGNISALSLVAEFHSTIQHDLRRCLRAITGGRPAYLADLTDRIRTAYALGVLTETQWTTVLNAEALARDLDTYAAAINANPSTMSLTSHLRQLTWWTDQPRVLREVLSDLKHLNKTAEQYLDGTDRTRLKADCPHCRRKTLVVYFEAGIVRCEKDPDSGRYENCVCPEPLCDCKTDTHHRHEWLRALGTAKGGWWKLADRINLTSVVTRSPS